MKKLLYTFLLLNLILTGCSSSDDNPPPVTIEDAEEEEMEDPEEVDETSGADLLYNGTAVMATEDARIPYVFYNTEGFETAIMDENLDGTFDKITLTEDDLETVIEMNPETGLPSKMYTSEGILVIYNFKTNNSMMDLAIVRPEQDTEYINDVDVSDFQLTAKNASGKSQVCTPLNNTLVTMANGYTWALGGWCKIKQDNNVVFQSLNLTARECRDIYRDRFPCCQISTYADVFCKQIPEQAKVLAEINQLVACTEDGDLSDCIGNGLIKVQDVVNNANTLRNEIGAEVIAQAENVIFNLVDNNPAGNNALLGTWLLEKQEEFAEGVVRETLVNVEYCDEPPFENSCYTILEASMTFNEDGTFESKLTENEKENGPDSPVSNEIIELTTGKWTYNETTEELLLVVFSEEYTENGVVIETITYTDETADIIPVERFTVSETDLTIVFDEEDNDADGIPEESYTEFYTKG